MGNVLSWFGRLAIRLLYAKKPQNPIVEWPEDVDSMSYIIMIVPGAFLYPSDYVALRYACRQQVVVTCSVNWAQIDVLDFMNSASRLVEAAIHDGIRALERSNHGPKLEKNSFGRYRNLIMVLHSLSGPVGIGCHGVFKKAAAVVLLGSGLSHIPIRRPISSSIRSFPFPLLYIFGEYDGQQHLAKVSIDLSTSGLALDLCKSVCEREHERHYFAMIANCNHASFSNGKRNASRGDLPLDSAGSPTQAHALNQVYSLVSSFAYAHVLNECGEDIMHHHHEILLDETKVTVALLGPYLRALGRLPIDEVDILDKETRLVYQYAIGQEMLPSDANFYRLGLSHPGQLGRAEEFAIMTQEYLLGDYRQRKVLDMEVIVTCKVHTIFENFLYSKVLEHRDSRAIYLEVQCLASCPCKGTGYSTIAPFYAMKLKSLSGLVGKQILTREMSPKDIFRLSWDKAIKCCPISMLQRFHRRGQELHVKEAWHCIPPLWAKSRSRVSKSGELTLQCYKPNLNLTRGTKVSNSIDISGILYCQVPSVAWCLEYMMVHGIR